MNAGWVIGILGCGLAVLFAWSFRHLPGERWQILAALPLEREPDGTWRSVNLTYYGVFNALAVAAGLAVALFLCGAAGLPWPYVAVSVPAFLAVVLPASRLLNRLVEGHWHGFTVGGGCFAGMAAGPWLAWGVGALTLPEGEAPLAVPYLLGAMAPAYALGEGIGRLACISFGCCYGRAVEDSPGWARKALGPMAFVFQGKLKKACYAHGYEGKALLPMQGVTAVLSTLAGLVGMALFLVGRPFAAFGTAMVLTQAWRFASEFLRADYRGAGRISAYQWMALSGVVYTLLLGALWPGVPSRTPDVARGLALLWTPAAILSLEAVAVWVFLRMGISTVTTSRVSLGLRHDRIQPVSSRSPTSDEAPIVR